MTNGSGPHPKAKKKASSRKKKTAAPKSSAKAWAEKAVQVKTGGK